MGQAGTGTIASVSQRSLSRGGSNRRHRMRYSAVLLLLLLAVTPMAAAAADEAMPPENPSYRLGPNDVIRIQVFGEDDLTVEGKISGDGTMNVPLLGPVRIGGRTAQEVRDEMTTRLAEGYIRQPKVAVYIVRYRNVYVSGEVKAPGGYPYENGLTVQQAISLAGGLTEKGERRGIRLHRTAEGGSNTIAVDLNTPLFPDDTVVVAPSEKVYVTGEVTRSGGLPYEDGLRLHKAITLAGGFTDKADKRAIKVTRVAQGQAQVIQADPELVLQPEDIVTIETENHKVYVSGEVRTPGGYPYNDGMTVHKALALAGGLTEKAERGDLQALRHTGPGREETVTVHLDSPVLPDDIIVVAEGQRVYVSGEVKTPGRYLYEKGMTVHKALSLAGGVTDRAEQGEVKLTRVADGQATTGVGEPGTPLQPDDILVVEPQNRRVYVSGEVKLPGGYPYKDNLNVQKAIAMAGGLTEKAERGTLKLVRVHNGREEVAIATENTVIFPEDTILVAEGQRFYVSGEVKAAGRYLYEPGVTVQKAITMAGGFTERADRFSMTVVRVNGHGIRSTAVEFDGLVMPDDVIVVSQAQKIYVNGEVKKPGDYVFEKGLTVHKAITMAGGFSDKAAEGRTKVLRTVNGVEQSVRVKLEDILLPDDIIVVPQSFF
jgi:polysaccharide export outer membrane protein